MTRILLIDDDQDVRTLLARMLTSAGYEVTVATNGNEGLRLFRQEQYEAVITDLIMPEKEGLETIKDLRVIAPDLPILAMSGGGRVDANNYLKLAERLGASSILAKPFGQADLLEAVSQLIQPPVTT